MGIKTKIDWCDSSWSPVTGCLHGCEYCYARKIAERFGGYDGASLVGQAAYMYAKTLDQAELVETWEDVQFQVWSKKDERGQPAPGAHYVRAPYPFGFKPTLHRELLAVPQKWKKPKTIFVCSMADLFGDWVPDEWIKEVLDACRKAPWHRYLFLTKNPDRYDDLEFDGLITPEDKNFWLGSTVTVETRDRMHYCSWMHTFQSCEPMLAPWPLAGKPNDESMRNGWLPEWVIFGAETGNRKGKVIPEKAWVDNAVQMCRNMGAKVFMKESLRGIMGADFVQEFPWEVSKNA